LKDVQPDRAKAPLVAALDIGTSSVKGAIYDADGRQVAGSLGTSGCRFSNIARGAAEFDTEQLAGEVFKCLDRLDSFCAGLDERVAAVGMCTFVGNLLGIDDDNRPVTPLYTYADTRGSEQVGRLADLIDERECHLRTGCRFHPAYWPVRIMWLASRRRELFARVSRLVTFGQWIHLQLFGVATLSPSVASWSGMLDRHAVDWDTHLVDILPIGEKYLPDFSRGSPRNGLKSEYAARWPRLAAADWFDALADGAAANVGSGCVVADRVSLTVGTSSALRVVLDGSPADISRGLWCYRLDGRRSLLGGALTEGGNIHAWAKDTLRIEDSDELETRLARIPPGEHGLLVLPLLYGERCPGWAADAKGAITGLTAQSGPEQILKACMESVALRLATVFELMQPALGEEIEIVASGGALLASSTWLQMMADVLGRQVSVSDVRQASARGTALLALEGLGEERESEEPGSLTGRVYEPDGGAHVAYTALAERQRELYSRLVAEKKRVTEGRRDE